MQDIKAMASKYLGMEIPEDVFQPGLESAQRKLETIIAREGDADGERRKDYYIAQLVAEAIRGELMTCWCCMQIEDKKRTAHATGSPSNQPQYSTTVV